MEKDNGMSETTNLFVYGTLMPGMGNYGLIEAQVHSTHPASTRGILCSLGSIPAMIPGNGLVRGVLLEVDYTALTRTDRLEGVPHFYQRRETTVTLDDGNQVEAWVYEHAEPSRVLHHPKLLVGHKNGVDVYAWHPHGH